MSKTAKSRQSYGQWPSALSLFMLAVKFEPTTPNMSQHFATRWPNARNMLRPTMLRFAALTCCDRLAGGLERALVYDVACEFACAVTMPRNNWRERP